MTDLGGVSRRSSVDDTIKYSMELRVIVWKRILNHLGIKHG